MILTVSITRGALDSIEAVIATSDTTSETGGALFGNEHTLYIASAAEPGPDAIHQPRYFLRDLEYTQRAADRAYAMDRSQWIGEWHTHPLGPPNPSELDLNTYASHLMDPELRFERFIALIWSTTPPRVSAWLLARTAHGIELRKAVLSIQEPNGNT